MAQHTSTCQVRRIGRSSAILCLLFATNVAGYGNARVLLDDARARVTLIELGENARYQITGARKYGSVWISLDSGVLLDFDGNARITSAGEGHAIEAGQIVTFRAREAAGGRVIVVVPKLTCQPLTVLSNALAPGGEQQDASSRNETLVVAVSSVELRDTRNAGDESVWISSAPRIIGLRSGQVTWLRAGIHHLKNLLGTPSEFVTIEW